MLIKQQAIGTRLRSGYGGVRAGTAWVVMKGRIASLRIGMAYRTYDSTLPRVGIAKLRLKGGEGQSRTVIGGRVEPWVSGGYFEAQVGIEFHIAQGNIVQVVRRHVAAGTEEIEQ